ncbi:prepilin-type N-terminal cleavage/methylation domain-containing protein [Planctomycetales bacterium ZRK34]|nr:prepilin-type N-terminal cleavage/methylation domain-containing protein [Planctomycetales bacterium ZRK34]
MNRSAFTLVEVLVVVAILLILLGLGIAYGPGMLAVSEEAQTRTILKNLKLINAEYEALVGEPVQAAGMSEFLQVVMSDEHFADLVAAFDDKVMHREDPTDDTSAWQIYDAWGNAIRYVAQAGAYPTCPQMDFAYFTSAGPDGQWGDHREFVKRFAGEAHDADLAAQAADNLYTFGWDAR